MLSILFWERFYGFWNWRIFKYADLLDRKIQVIGSSKVETILSPFLRNLLTRYLRPPNYTWFEVISKLPLQRAKKWEVVRTMPEESDKVIHNLTGNFHSCLIITLTVIKQNLEQFIFYWNDFCRCGKSCFINSKYFGIYELNVKQTKFVNLNIVLLNENTGTLFNVLNLIKFPFRIIVLREHKIRLNSPISNINSSPFVIIKWKALTVEKTSL